METSSTSVPSAAPAAATGSSAYQRSCFLRQEPRIRAVPDNRLINVTVDRTYAITVVLGAAPRFMALRPRMEKLGGEIDLTLVDSVVDLAYAVSYLSNSFCETEQSEESIAQLYEEGLKLRERLADVMDLALKQEIVRGALITPLRRTTGKRNVGADLTSIFRFYEDSWTKLEGKTPISKSDVDRADYIATRLLNSATASETAPADVVDAEHVRHQAFTLFMEAYAEVRAAVALLRRKEGDAEIVTPSVHSGRAAPRRKDGEEDVPVAAGTAVGGTVGTGAGGVSAGNAVVPKVVVPVGHPGSDPFISQ